MLKNSITIKTSAIGLPAIQKTYNRTSSNGTSGTFQNPEAPLATPDTLRVSHETSKDGSVVNSAIILKKEIREPITLREGKVQVTLKVTYNPDIVTRDDVKTGLAEMAVLALGSFYPGANNGAGVEFLTDYIGCDADINAFINQEA